MTTPMHVDVVQDEAALAECAADMICELVTTKPDPVLALPTGDTPVLTYERLVRRESADSVDFSRMIVFAIDEFLGVPRDAPGTNSRFYRQHLRLRVRALHIPNPSAREPEAHIRAFAESVRRLGGLDLCVLGIGTNGHIAFNEPGSGRESGARVVDLARESREAHAAGFGSIENVPPQAMTLGVADLLEAKRILVLAQGEPKAEIVRRAVEDPPSADVPASWMQAHGGVMWLLDEAAASHLRG